MRIDQDGVSLWFGTPDAPAPEGTVAEGSSASATIAIQPPDASNRVEVVYRINGGTPQTLSAVWFRTDPVRKVQYFRAEFPPLRPGDKVEYSAICRCVGRQIPSAAEVAQFTSSFRVGELPSAGAEKGSSPLHVEVPLRTGGGAKEAAILAEAELRAVKERATNWLMRIPGVHAVGLGPKIKDGKRTGEISIVVFTLNKRPSSQVPADESAARRLLASKASKPPSGGLYLNCELARFPGSLKSREP